MARTAMPATLFRSALLASVVISTGALSACTTTGKTTPQEQALVNTSETNSILPATREERDAIESQDLLTQATFWGKEYDKNPNEYEASLKLARALRAIGSTQRATEVASQALNLKQGDVELTLIYAQASLDQGRPDQAATALAKAEAAGLKDWRMMSIIGVTMDQLDQHAAARTYYQKALALSPDNPKVLSNMGLSYALDAKPKLAEETLRKAASLTTTDPRVQENLALVLGVQGKFDEAEKAVSGDMPKELVDSNAKYFRTLLTPARSWDNLRGSKN